jgi:nitrite reductase/ring-hydroxylating ferredoxin subunit
MEKGWIKIAESSEEIPFGANGIAEIEAGGKHFCLAKFKGNLFAFVPKCPHASGRFHEGFIVCRVMSYVRCTVTNSA